MMKRLGTLLLLALAVAAFAQQGERGQAGGQGGRRGTRVENSAPGGQQPTTPGLPAGNQPSGAGDRAADDHARLDGAHDHRPRRAALLHGHGGHARPQDRGRHEGRLPVLRRLHEEGRGRRDPPDHLRVQRRPRLLVGVRPPGNDGTAPRGPERRWHDAQAALQAGRQPGDVARRDGHRLGGRDGHGLQPPDGGGRKQVLRRPGRHRRIRPLYRDLPHEVQAVRLAGFSRGRKLRRHPHGGPEQTG